MIGFQILATEQENGTFICDKVSPFFSIEVSLLNDDKNLLKKNAERLYTQQDGSGKTEFILTKNELEAVFKSTTCIKGREGYHELACDGIVVIPKTKDSLLSWKEFKKTKNDRINSRATE